MVDISEDFGQLYRNALAERDPTRKALWLRCVQEALDIWAETGQALPPPGPLTPNPRHTPVKARITRGGVYERSLPSVA